MPDAAPDKNQPIDLSSLDGLTLGTAWSSSNAGNRHDEQEGDHPRSSRPPFRERRSFDGPPQNRGFNKGSRDNRGNPAQNGRPRRDGLRERSGSNDRRPVAIEPPTLKVIFYPEEASLKALTKAIKASKRTYELFEISRLILEKPDRTVATVCQKPNAENKSTPLYLSIADGLSFLTESEALQHAATAALEKFFHAEEVEVEAPKGNFAVIHRCGITGRLIAPPNYHRYAQLLNEHQSKNLPQMTVAAIQARIESVKEPEQIAAWIEGMKKATRYTLLNPPTDAGAAQPTTFDGAEAAIAHLISNHKANLVKPINQARLNHKQQDALPKGELRRSIEAARAIQLKFPLETANNLRGRLRRMGFNLYKRGQKGVSYLSAVKRRFRVVGQTFAPEVQQVIEFIEKTPNISDGDIPRQMLGITPPTSAPVQPPQASAAEGENPAAPTPVPALTPEEETAFKKLRQTLQWLVEEGYVIHFGNGGLFVPPARQPNAPNEEGEEEETLETHETTQAVIEPGATTETTDIPMETAASGTVEGAKAQEGVPFDPPAPTVADEGQKG